MQLLTLEGEWLKVINGTLMESFRKKKIPLMTIIDVGIGLCEKKYTSPGIICAYGGSAGGLLVGAAINQAPKLFAGAVAAVPFVDVLNTMSDSQLPLTPPEWPEWGNPLINSDDYDCIAAYSPLRKCN